MRPLRVRLRSRRKRSLLGSQSTSRLKNQLISQNQSLKNLPQQSQKRKRRHNPSQLHLKMPQLKSKQPKSPQFHPQLPRGKEQSYQAQETLSQPGNLRTQGSGSRTTPPANQLSTAAEETEQSNLKTTTRLSSITKTKEVPSRCLAPTANL